MSGSTKSSTKPRRPRDPGARLTPLITPALRKAKLDPARGYLDLSQERREHFTPATVAMRMPLVSAIYERWWRPALGRIAKGSGGPSMTGEYELAAELLELGPGDVMLDLACGPGNFTRRFAHEVGSQGLAVGLDGSASMLNRAVSEASNQGTRSIAFVRAEATTLPFVDDAFDALCCFAALHMFPDPLASLDEIARVIKPDGRIALLTSLVGGRLHDPVSHLVGRVSGMRMFGADELRGELETRGFTVVEQRCTGAVQIVGAQLG